MQSVTVKDNRTVELVPRKVVRWAYALRTETVAQPTPFDSERAKAIIIESADPFRSTTCNVMTDGEIAYTLTVWDAIVSGSSCFMSALCAIRDNQVTLTGSL